MSHPHYKNIGDPIDRLVEELAELTMALMKVKRFGWFNVHPDKKQFPLTNIEQVKLEMSDVVEAIENLEQTMRQESYSHFNTTKEH